MKQLLLYPTLILFFLFPLLIMSQTYKVDEMRSYSWDENAMPVADWVLESTIKNTFANGGNKETKSEVFVFPSTVATIQIIKTYNTINNIIKSVISYWDPDTMVWQEASQTTYEYNGVNKLEKEITKTYNPSTMTFSINSSQTLYEYSGSDISKETKQSWDFITTNWVDSNITETTYRAPGEPSVSTYSYFSNNTWQIERDIFIYNGLGLIDKVEYYDPDGFGGWILNGRSLLEYSGTLITKVTQQDWEDPNWIDTDRDLNTYDANGNLKKYIIENVVLGIWEPSDKIEQDFSVASPFSLSNEFFEIENFKVYPNPSSDIINISSKINIEKLEMFDISGKIIFVSRFTKQINAKDYKPGIYFLKLSSETKSITKKIIIK